MQSYQQTIEDICRNLETDKALGLTSAQYQQCLQKHGYNKLKTTTKSSLLTIFFSQFADPLTYILFGAAILIFLVGQALDASIIACILMFNAIIGTVQTKRSEKILHRLQSFFSCDSVVIRDGKHQIIDNHFIVPGDLIYLSAGEKIPADARIVSCTNFSTDESTLTGESNPAIKIADTLDAQELAISDQKNSLFAGTYVLSGQATAIVFATGQDTQVGKIHKSLEAIDTNTPLKKELEDLSHWILIFIIIMCGLLFIIGLATHKPIIDLLVMLTALFICVLPEGLPVVLTIVFISGAYKMAQHNVLVKRLKAIEALGRIDTIIVDKTGTLTRNEMVVNNVYIDGQTLQVSGSGYFVQGSIENQEQHRPSLEKIAIACALLNDTKIDFDEKLHTFKIKGSPTQAAAFIFAQKINPEIMSLVKDFTINHTIPFDSIHKYAAVYCKNNETNVAFVLGAPEIVVSACKNKNIAIENQLQKYFAQGSRVVAIAQKTYSKTLENNFENSQALLQSGLEFLGLVAIADEPRENLSSIIAQIHQNNVQIIMATGDHLQTALYVAQKVGIISNDHDVITSSDFSKLSDQQVIDLLGNKNFICARFLPQDKLRLVQLCKQQEKIVAVTGDGINDVPALVAADVSIAMGSIGTELTKEAADMILMHDSFENIIYAMHQGRAMFYALRRTILYFLISNTTEVFVIFFGLALSIPLPLLPSQILLLNLISDGFLDAALATEPSHTSHTKIHAEKPSKIFNKATIYKTLYLALPASLLSFAVFLWFYKTDLDFARTLTLITLIMAQWFNALNCRSETKSIFHIGLISNFWLVMATIAIFIIQILIVYAPALQYIFKTVPIGLHHWIYAITIASSLLFIEELRKYIAERFFAK